MTGPALTGPALQPTMSESTVVPLHLPVPIASTQGTLALDLQPALEPPRAMTPVPGGPVTEHELHGWVMRFAQAVVEIVGGDRPVSQLVRWTSKEVHQDLQRRAVLVTRAVGHQPGVARIMPVRPRILSAHLSAPRAHVVEASIHVRYGERSRALAARFERRTDRWICTALEFA